MLINCLIRTSYRPTLFKRCLDSVLAQSHTNIRIIVSYDDERALEYIPEGIEKIKVEKNLSLSFGYDNYCNDLKQEVVDGWFFFLDDDEYLVSTDCINKVCKHLNGVYGLVVQFSRNGRLKPSNELIRAKRTQKSKIGMPCLFLHHSFKDTMLDGSVPAADFNWIKEVSKHVKLKFVPIVVAFADRRSYGQLEGEN